MDTCAFTQAGRERWSEGKANRWYCEHGWLIGMNYIPASAVNQLEMWQAETFDPFRIELELGWAADLGMTVVRVFLHDLLWCDDAEGFCSRLNSFLDIAARNKIRTIFVLFDSCWHPNPELGIQRSPAPGIHNSGWVQSPGAAVLSDPECPKRLEDYVKGVISRFAQDSRVFAWDLWNEPDNENTGSYSSLELKQKLRFVEQLLPQVFNWARGANPSQPLTSGVWFGDWSSPDKLTAIQRTQIEESDILSFHNYESPDDFEQRVTWLQRYGRPLLCTEYMARGAGSTFKGILPVARLHNVAAINWGFVQGKSQTHFPWDSWQSPYVSAPPLVWFHEILHTDGTPYDDDEVQVIRAMAGVKPKTLAAKAGV
jgi:hypothetical protein